MFHLPVHDFRSQLSDTFPSGGQRVKHPDFRELRVATFNVDYGTKSTDHMVRGQQSGWTRDLGPDGALCPHFKKTKMKTKPDKQTKPTVRM